MILNDTLISVIVPVFNAEKFIEATLSSITRQTHTNFEVLIVNDGSVDNSKKIIQDYIADDSRFHYFEITNSGGPATPRNYGIDRARGDYICFLDADDIWKEKKLEAQLKGMISYQSDWSHMRYQSFTENGQINFGIQLPKKPQDFHGNVLRTIALRSEIGTSTVMVRKDVMVDVGKFDTSPRLSAVEDFDLWLRIGSKYRIDFIDSEVPLILYRKTDSSISYNVVKQQRKRIKVLKKNSHTIGFFICIYAQFRSLVYLIYKSLLG